MSEFITLNDSFIEQNARERIQGLLDEGTFRELMDPFEQYESPHLTAQGFVPQSDDGVVIARGAIKGEAAIMISIDGAFQGGGIGEVGGAKMAGALEMALSDCKNGHLIHPVFIFNTGGVRLQEGNHGLLAIAEVCAAILALRQYVPVIGIIPGLIGCFGGMSICAGLCSYLVMTKQGRLGLNGPDVIEQEAGLAELNASDRPLIWSLIGGEQRCSTGFADMLVQDTTESIQHALQDGLVRGIPAVHRSSDIEGFVNRISQVDAGKKMTGIELRSLWATEQTREHGKLAESQPKPSRGNTWLERLSGSSSTEGSSSVLCADGTIENEPVKFVTVVPNSSNRFARARSGEIGIEEGWTLAKLIHDTVREDVDIKVKRPIVAVIDVKGQAYGYMEELLGMHLACSAAVDAYATARMAGHPVISLLVGHGISGAFLAHGLQANRIIALDDPEVMVQVMSKPSAAKITRRTETEMEEISEKFPATAYDIRSFATLGAVEVLIVGVRADDPDQDDLNLVRGKIADAIAKTRTQKNDLACRLASKESSIGRKASIQVRKRIADLWN